MTQSNSSAAPGQVRVRVRELFDLDKSIAGAYLERYEYPWEVLPHIKGIVLEIGAGLPEDEYRIFRGYPESTPRADDAACVWVHRSVTLPPTATVAGPAIICEGAEIRPGAFIRGNAIIGRGAVVGNSTEVKNAILFDGVQAPHFNYVGDSIFGYKAHTGAGVITSNVRSDKRPVQIHTAGGDVDTGLKKVGAMLGDGAEIGCNTVLNPGSVVGRGSIVYPLSCVRGCVPAGALYKRAGEVVARRDG
ncbi:MAG: UDP-N-acetylglucosamine pyrophosphorylase [Lachnospiraceae bacterium]|nr:UDP-N-acetylglucosamine pyrophosphorylase [Lachnospiraceae bacterium]